MKTWLKENWFKTALILSLLLISFSVAYHFVYFLPQKEKIELVQQGEKFKAWKFYGSSTSIISLTSITSPSITSLQPAKLVYFRGFFCWKLSTLSPLTSRIIFLYTFN